MSAECAAGVMEPGAAADVAGVGAAAGGAGDIGASRKRASLRICLYCTCSWKSGQCSMIRVKPGLAGSHSTMVR